MSFRTGTRSLLLALAALLPSASGCGARSDLVIGGPEGPAVGGHDLCADGSRAGAVGCRSVAFADAVSYPVGGGLGWGQLVVVDLNGDGALDIAVTVGTTVTVLLNQGHGGFSNGGSYPTSLHPSGLSAGDLNNDGFVDLVVGSLVDQGNFVSVLLNHGHGAFAPGVPYAAGLSPTRVALGDLGGDGLLDIATANARGDNASVLSNLGDGTFGLPVTYGPVHIPVSIAVADLDRDGRLDLAVTSGINSGFDIFLNAGGGTFADPISYPDPEFLVHELAVGDVSGDGWPDLVFLRGGDVHVRLNAGGGAFGDAASYAVADATLSLALGDLNGDCRLDIATVGQEAGVSVLPNLGDGTFGPAAARVVGGRPQSVAVGDLDGDGRPDLVISYGDTGVVSVLLNRGCVP